MVPFSGTPKVGVAIRPAHFGTAVGSYPSGTNTSENMNRYMKLKNAAKALLLAGDVDRYLQALRLMHGLKARHLGMA